MSTRPPKTRFPFPPEGPLLPFPESAPMFTCIADLTGYWIEIVCECRGRQLYPLRLMAARIGWEVTIADMVPKLRCQMCQARPGEVWLLERDDGDGHTKPRGRKLDLRGV